MRLIDLDHPQIGPGGVKKDLQREQIDRYRVPKDGLSRKYLQVSVLQSFLRSRSRAILDFVIPEFPAIQNQVNRIFGQRSTAEEFLSALNDALKGLAVKAPPRHTFSLVFRQLPVYGCLTISPHTDPLERRDYL